MQSAAVWLPPVALGPRKVPRLSRERSIAPVALAGIGLALLLVGHGFWAVVPTVALAAGLIPAETALRRTMLCVPGLVGATSCLLTVTALLQVALDARVLVAFVLIGLAGLRLALPPPHGGDWWTRGDRWAILAPAGTFLVVYRPYFGRSTGEQLALLSNTTDASTHLGLIRSSLLEGGYVTLVAGQDERLLGGSQGYPPGLAGNLGLLLQLLIGRDPSIPALVAGTVPLLVGLYALLAWLATWTAITMVEAVSGRINRSTAALTTCSVTAAFILGFNVLLWNSAAYAQVLATVAVLASLAVLMKPHSRVFGTSVFLAFVTVASVHSWYLLAPAMVIPWLYHLFGPSCRRRALNTCPLLIAGLFAVFPIVNGPEASSQLNAAGGIGIPAAPSLVAFLLVSLWATWLLTTRCKSTRSSHLLIVFLLVGLLLFAVALGAFQVVISGAAQYYSGKVLYSGFVTSSIIIGAAAGILWQRRNINTAAWPRLLAAAAIVGLSLSSAMYGLHGTRSDVARIAFGGAPADKSRLLQAAVAAYPQGVPGDTDVWFGDDCRRGFERIFSKALQDLSLTWSTDRERMFVTYVTRRPGVVDPFLKRATESSVRLVEVYVQSPCYAASLTALEGAPGVVVVRVP